MKSFSTGACGRLIDDFVARPATDDVDVCGENGEYHSFVFDGPIFKYPIPYTKGDRVQAVLKHHKQQTSCNLDGPAFHLWILLL